MSSGSRYDRSRNRTARATRPTIPKNVRWKKKLPGRGFSSPIVVSQRVFVTSFTGGDGGLTNLKRQLLCLSRDKGEVLWTREVPATLPEFRSAGRIGYHGYASSTPVSDGERVYVLFGTTGSTLRPTNTQHSSCSAPSSPKSAWYLNL